jgi:glyoxylase-like metal-dependent hydrolase (beta-lactamase superfamily II)
MPNLILHVFRNGAKPSEGLVFLKSRCDRFPDEEIYIEGGDYESYESWAESHNLFETASYFALYGKTIDNKPIDEDMIPIVIVHTPVHKFLGTPGHLFFEDPGILIS